MPLRVECVAISCFRTLERGGAQGNIKQYVERQQVSAPQNATLRNMRGRQLAARQRGEQRNNESWLCTFQTVLKSFRRHYCSIEQEVPQEGRRRALMQCVSLWQHVCLSC
jgi:hypothetical protein